LIQLRGLGWRTGPSLFGSINVKYTAARLAFVAMIAATAGIFIGIVVYFTLVAALIFLLLATAVVITIKINARKRARGSLEGAAAAPVQRVTRPRPSGHDESRPQ
jgi:hypothetical protein